jgi:hypothetical protein
MKTTDTIINTINRFPKGYVFTCTDFSRSVKQKEALIKALNRLAASGTISKLAKGRYYKPEQTAFGTLQPDTYQVVKDLLEENGKLVGYLTGYSIYNKLGLSTQLSNQVQIGKNEVRTKFKRGVFTISFVKQKNTITSQNVAFLQLLDAIKYIKKIPDSSIQNTCIRFLSLLKPYKIEDINTLVRLAQKYPPATKALLGALLDECGKTSQTVALQKNLNPITSYELIGVSEILSTTEKWNIK